MSLAAIQKLNAADIRCTVLTKGLQPIELVEQSDQNEYGITLITPNLIQQNLTEILEAVSFTNRIIFGRTNYNKEISAYSKHRAFYNEQADVVIQFCNERDIDYHIKNGTMT